MTLEMWIAFILASSAMLAIPGPTVMLVVSYVLGRDRSTGWYTVPGVILGDFVAMTASLLGAGAILAASATLFSLMKLGGAAYLIWLGVKLWRQNSQPLEPESSSSAKSRGPLFWHSFTVTALNPKSIMFFIAFVPLFVTPAAPIVPQFLILEATFLVLAALNIVLWVFLTSRLKSRFKSPATLKFTNRIGAGILVGAGLLTAAIQRN